MLMYSILTVVQYTVQDCVHWAQVSVNCKPVFKFFMKYKLVATLFRDIEVKNPLKSRYRVRQKSV